MTLKHKSLNKTIAFLIAFAALFMAASTSFAETKVGVVDIKKVMETVPDGKKALNALKADLKKKQKQLDQKKKEFETLRDKLAKRSSVQQITPDEQRELQQKAIELQQMFAQLQQELAEAEIKAQAKILKKVQAAAKKVATKNSYDLIIERSEVTVLYANDNIDLTDEVIKQYGK